VQQVVCEKVARAAGTAPVVVSYLDPAFPKRLESSLRFGNTLVVTDAEGIDPLLNPVLGREYSSLGGRSTVTVGASEVDVSPAFQMFMFTSDATHQFAPDILSRVTAVNNSVTPGSLRSVALARILTAQRPDIAKQRGEALKLAAEYTAQLRQLEDDVLTQLSSSTASLLEDDATLKAMERLKQETAVVENKAADVASALEQLTAVTSGYEPLVAAAVEVYFALRKLPALHAMYRWSLHFFLSALDRTLAAAPSADTPDTITNTVWALARTVLGAVRPCMFRAHAAGLTAGVLLACSEALGCSPPSQEVTLVQGRVPATDATLPEDVAKVLPPAARASLAALTALPHQPWPRLAESLTQNTEDWVQHFSEGRAQPTWQEEDGGDAVRHAAWVPLVLQAAAAPAGLWAAVARWESALLGDEAADCAMTLEDAVRGSDRVVLRSAPVFIAGAAGVDVVQRAQEAAAGFTSALHTVPMGDPDSFDAARAAVDRAMSGGDWSGKRGKVHAKFRIILCAEVGEEGTRIPAALLRVSTKVTLQRPAGMRAAVLGALHCIPRGLWSKAPVESTRVLFALAWLHASVSERCRYAPLGWTKRYTFSDGDLTAAAVSVGRWMDLQYGQGAVPGHVEPGSLPWEALRKLVGGAHHAGRLSTDVDAAVLLHLAEAVLTPSIFDADHNLSLGPGEQLAPPPPAANSLDAFEAWARRLPPINPPAWLGLPAGCEQATLSREGSDIAAAFSAIAAGQ
ncbi:dhc-1, partial [Symbiodinium sp. KB8]